MRAVEVGESLPYVVLRAGNYPDKGVGSHLVGHCAMLVHQVEVHKRTKPLVVAFCNRPEIRERRG